MFKRTRALMGKWFSSGRGAEAEGFVGMAYGGMVFTGGTDRDLIGERKMVVRVGLAAEWIETWPLTERSECDNFTVHVNERLS